MQELMPLSEAFGVLMNTKYREITKIESEQHALYAAYSSWKYFVKSKLIPKERYDTVLQDEQFGILFVLLDNLTDHRSSNTLKYNHSIQLLSDCFINEEHVNDFMFGTFIHILKRTIDKEQPETSIQIQQYKYSICTFFIEIILGDEFNKNKQQEQTQLLIQMNDRVFDKFEPEQLVQILDCLWMICRFESVVMDSRRCATKLTSKAADLISVIAYCLSIRNHELIVDMSDLFMKTSIELLHWFEPHRDLYSQFLRYFISKQKEIQKVVIHLRALERSEREKDKMHAKEGRAFAVKSLCSLFSCYSIYLVEERDYFEMFVKYLTNFEKKNPKQDVTFDFILAIILEIENSKEEAQMSYNLACLIAIIGKFRKKDQKKYFTTQIKSANQNTTLYEALTQLTNNKLLRVESDELGIMSVHLYKELVAYSGAIQQRGSFLELLEDMLESEDTVSKAIILFVSEVVRNEKSQVYTIFKYIESENEKTKKNGLRILAEIFNTRDEQTIDEELVQVVTSYLIKRLAEEDLSIRSCAATVFSHLNTKVVLKQLLPLYLSKNEKERSAAHEALIKIMDSNTENPNCFMDVIDCIKDITIENNKDIESNRKQLAERVMTFLPKYLTQLSPSATKLLVMSTIKKFFEFNTDPILVFMLNKILNFTLTVEHKTNTTTEDEYLLNSKKELLFAIIELVLEKLMQERKMTQDENLTIFEELAPLLVLKTLPVSIFFFMHPCEDYDNLFTNLLKILISNLKDHTAVEELRRVSAEVASKLPPRQTFQIFVDHFAKLIGHEIHTNTNLKKAKAFIFCICQSIALYEEDPYILSYLTQDTNLIPTLKRVLLQRTDNEEFIKIQQGCMDCLSMIIKYMLHYPQHSKFISETILEMHNDEATSSITSTTENISILRISLSNIVTKTSKILPLKHQLSFATITIPYLVNILLHTRRESTHVELSVPLFASSLQALLNIIYQIKSAVHPFSKMILESISKCLSDTDGIIRLFALKALSAILYAREDVLTDYQTIFEFEILKKVKGMASIESNSEVKKLATELCKIMGIHQ
ncbi:hypothetical protein FDP41_003121 [Naegleria fowleri]|uniref:Uncharacterized protein n=1 Tax=Naegleria fowleri TaxID=5763 RepID=A0A6A5BXY2_NAEFO|nr:uncharacterized protein FDP41_003121 [Naegleria fowleri]KAF0977799.1 hypothetical protein FDP41_003121 [Naegleria fowleri]